MTVTEGSLTQRLGQMIDSIGVFFATVGNKLDSVIALLGDVKAALQPTTGNAYLLDVRDAIGTTAGQDSLRQALTTLLAPNTVANRRNIFAAQATVDLVRGNTAGSRATLYDLNVAVDTMAAFINDGSEPRVAELLIALRNNIGNVTPTAENTVRAQLAAIRQSFTDLMSADLLDGRENLADLLLELQSFRADIGANTIPEYVTLFSLIKQVRDGIGTTGATSTLAQLLNVISECVCELNAKTPDPDPPVDTFPAGHACAPANLELLFTIGPSDWYQSQNGTWYGCPASLQAAMGPFWAGAEKIPEGDNAARRMLQYIGSFPPDFSFCYVASSQSTDSLNLYPYHGRVVIEQSYEASFNAGAESVGVQNVSGGCKNMALLSGDSNDVYWRLTYMPPGGTSGDLPAPGTLYFYRVPV
jgi:hypothetical protein